MPLTAQNDCPVWDWAEDLAVGSWVDIIDMERGSNGNFYFLGSFQGATVIVIGGDTLFNPVPSRNFFIAKRDSAGQWVWAEQLQIGSGMPGDFFLDASGHITLTGWFGTTASFGAFQLNGTSQPPNALFVAKFDVGSKQWVWASKAEYPWGGIGGTGVAVDTAGDVYVAGYTHGPTTPSTATFGSLSLVCNTSPQSFIAKISSTGNWLWVHEGAGTSLSSNDLLSTVILDNSGNPILFGTFQNQLTINGQTATATGQDLFLIKFDPQGQPQWLQTTTDGGIRAHSITRDSMGDFYITGTNYASDTTQFGNLAFSSTGPFLAKINTHGQWKWAVGIGTIPNYWEFPAATTPSGDNFIVGYADNVCGQDSALAEHYRATTSLAKYDSAGNWKWCGMIPEAANPKAMVHDGRDGVYISGGHGKNTTFDTHHLPNQGNFLAHIIPHDSLSLNLPNDVTLYCGDTVELVPSTPAVSYLQCQWSPTHGLSDSTDVTPMASPDSTTTYTLMATTAGGCTDSASITVQISSQDTLSVDIPKDTTLYCGDSLKLVPSALGRSYLNGRWSPAYGLSDTTALTPMAAPDSTTTYTLIASTGVGCTDTARITVHVDSSASYLGGVTLHSSTGGTDFCHNTSPVISTTHPFETYMWNTGDTTAAVTADTAGTYRLTGIDSNGCYISGSITLRPLRQVTAPNLLLCHGDSVRLFMNPNNLDSLRWSTGSSAGEIFVKQPGLYTATAYKGGCHYTDSVEVVSFTDTANATFIHSANALNVDFAPNSIGIAQGFWDFGDGNTSLSVTASHTYAAPGVYEVCYQATDVCGFESRHCDSISITLIGLAEAGVPAKLNIYPNPTSGIIHLESSLPRSPELRVTDLSGKLLLHQKLQKAERWEVDLGSLPKGYYLVSIAGETRQVVKL